MREAPRKRLFAILAVAVLALPASALGKGPSAATMNGPGGGSITFGGDEGSGPLGALTEQSGWFAAVFDQTPSPMLAARPNGELGPRYTVTYTVPGGASDTFIIRQQIYPYAKPGPVTYLAPGQRIFDTTTRGGWFQAGPELKETLTAAGLQAPASTPTTPATDDSAFPTAAVALLGFALLFVTATAFLVRRRTRPAAA